MRIRGRHQRCRLDLVTRRGHDYLTLENGLIRVTFVLTKGADLLEFRHKPSDVDAMWHSPHPLNPPGQQIPTMASAAGNFLDHYAGGWQEVLPAGGGPVTFMGADIGLHGEAALLPWEAEVVADTPERVAVRMGVALRRTPFTVERTITLEEGRLGIDWEGRITNEGELELPYMWGQHAAFGEPFVEAGCRIDLPPATVTTLPEPYSRGMRFAERQSDVPWPNLRTVGGDIAPADVVPDHNARTHDTYNIRPDAGWFAIRNQARDLGFALSWDHAVYPNLWAWQVYGGFWDSPYFGRTYVLALEPFSSPMGSLTDNIERRTCQTLAAGASRDVRMHAGFFRGAAEPVRGVDEAGDPLR